MTRKTKFLLTILPLVFFDCNRQHECDYSKANPIISIQVKEDNVIAYWHYVVSKGVYRDCMDSSATIELIQEYIKSATAQPVYKISLFNKVEDFDKGENLSQPKSFFKNRMVDVYFDTLTHKPKQFVFYDNSGNEITRGEKWKK